LSALTSPESVAIAAAGPEARSKPPRRPASRATVGQGAQKGALYVMLGAAAFIAIFPIFWVLSGSLQTTDEIYRSSRLIPSAPQWSNYVSAWTDGDLNVYLPNSILYTGTAVFGILVVSSMAGYVLARFDFRGKGFIIGLLLAVLIIPAPASFIAQYKLLLTLGLTNSRIGYVLILITAGIPVSTLIMRGFFANQPKDLEEAAALDGASMFATFARVILPLARPGLAAVAVIQGLAAWNEYLMALVLFDDDALMPIQRGLTSFLSSETPQQNILLAATAIGVLPVIVFYMAAQRHIIQGLGSGALK
jgi:raffinose/stachyose/melibiose transport system permease protein